MALAFLKLLSNQNRKVIFKLIFEEWIQFQRKEKGEI